MNILYILHNTGKDGSLITWMYIARYMSQNGCRVLVAGPKQLLEIPEYNKLCDECYIQTYPCEVFTDFQSKFPSSNFKLQLRWLKRYVKDTYRHYKVYRELLNLMHLIRPDIVHTNVGVLHEGFWAARHLQIPHVWHLREYQDLDWGFQIFPTKCLFELELKQSYVISITRDIFNYFHIEEDSKHRVIYDGVYSNIERPNIIYPKQKYFLTACTLAPNKGLECAINAFNIFNKSIRGYRLYIAGRDRNGYMEKLKNLVEELHLSDVVYFMGMIPHAELKEIMQSATALLVPSLREGFGLMTAEAIFNGTPVIGRATGGTKEIIENTGGFLFEKDEKHLANKMKELVLSNKQFIHKLVERAQDIAVEAYSIEQNVTQILSLYNTILKNDISKLC